MYVVTSVRMFAYVCGLSFKGGKMVDMLPGVSPPRLAR